MLLDILFILLKAFCVILIYIFVFYFCWFRWARKRYTKEQWQKINSAYKCTGVISHKTLFPCSWPISKRLPCACYRWDFPSVEYKRVGWHRMYRCQQQWRKNQQKRFMNIFK